MTVSSIDVFETTLHKANRWLKELMEELGWEDRHAAYLALRATLHALRDRLTVEEVAHLGAQLPMLIRGVYYEGWDPTGKPVPERRVEAFLLWIAQQFADDPLLDPEPIARGVFRMLARRVSDGEIEDIKHVLPARIRELWP
jgi:uncharacterized protein (DUF2267 family)